MVKSKTKDQKNDATGKTRTSRVSQLDVPANTLTNAIRVATAINENYANDPVTPLQLAQALNMSPTSGPFKTLTGSSIAYGLTEGGYNAKEIKLTQLGQRIVSPLEEGDDLTAKVEAVLKPRVINEFLTKYSGKQIPREDIALNVLQQMNVPRDRAKDVFDMIIASAESLNLITEIKDKKYVELSGASNINIADTEDQNENLNLNNQIESPEINNSSPPSSHNNITAVEENLASPNVPPPVKNKKVFITHGKNRELIGTIRKLLKYGELEAVVSVEKESVSKPVPEKLMHDMRECGAAIIHVDVEETLINQAGETQAVLNSNVLIEIGAAMALYGKRFILLVQEGVSLPSNLQGLYEVRYSGNDLGSDGTLKLLDSINAMKDEKIPDHISF